MADNDFSMGYAMGRDGTNNCGGFGGMWGDGLWAIIILGMLGFGGGFGGFGGGYMMNGALTRAELYDGFALNGIDNGVRGVQQGICDSTFALNNSLKDGFYGLQGTLCNMSHQISDCCCSTKQAIADSTREILGYLTNEKIDSLRLENQALKFQASQVAQNQFITQVGSDIVNRLQPPPVPAYTVPNPYTGYGYGYGYGAYNSNCGCGC